MNDKKDHILQTALILFAEEGLSVPTAKIAKEAGVANGTLFNYFPNKQILIDTVYVQIKKEIVEVFSLSGSQKAESFREVFFLVWKSYIHWALENTLKHKAASLLKTSNALSAEVLNQSEVLFMPWHSLVQNAIKDGKITKIDIEYLYQLKAAQIDALINQALIKKLKGKALDNHIQLGFDIYWKGITP